MYLNIYSVDMNSAECGHSAVGRSDQLIGARPSLVPGVRTVTLLWTHNGFCSTQDVRILKHLGGVGYLHEDTRKRYYLSDRNLDYRSY